MGQSMNDRQEYSEKLVQKYIAKYYDACLEVKSFDNKNQCFDLIASGKSLHLTIELKTRYFETQYIKYLNSNDILIELIQTLPYLKETELKQYNSYAVNTSIGWFYKCLADRLIYIRLLDGEFHDLIDLDFIKFKNWLLDNFSDFKLLYSNKSTGTINCIVPFNKIPKPLYFYKGKLT